jgi:toxin FitB
VIVLDTNVVSEAMRIAPHPAVVAWLDRQSDENVHLTAISLAELRSGAELLPNGRRKKDLQEKFADFLKAMFAGRLLAFDASAAEAYASIVGETRRKGRILSILDCQIAAIAKANHCAVATRDVRPYADAGLQVVNPWTDE